MSATSSAHLVTDARLLACSDNCLPSVDIDTMSTFAASSSRALLYMLARGAEAIIEFGTSFGISTLHLAAAQLGEYVDIREGDALETFARDLPATIDLVLFDGAKPLYSRMLTLVEPRLRKGAILVADNVEASPDYLRRVRSSGDYASLPFAVAGDSDGTASVELSVKVG